MYNLVVTFNTDGAWDIIVDDGVKTVIANQILDYA